MVLIKVAAVELEVRSSAKWLRVPAGTQATTASEPSPPATPRASAPRVTASSTNVANPARAAFPPPDFGLRKSTGLRGGHAPALMGSDGGNGSSSARGRSLHGSRTSCD